MKTANIRAGFRGAVKREDRKPRFDLIRFEFLESVARVLSSGAVKYGPYNWKQRRKDFFLDAWKHAFVHLEKFKQGDTTEDHLARLACGVRRSRASAGDDRPAGSRASSAPVSKHDSGHAYLRLWSVMLDVQSKSFEFDLTTELPAPRRSSPGKVRIHNGCKAP